MIEPPELAAALDADPVARANWDAFPPSARKFGIAFIDSAKRPETQAARVAKIVADAAAGKRPIWTNRPCSTPRRSSCSSGTLVVFGVTLWRRRGRD